jgi:shikimate dehydrogenase
MFGLVGKSLKHSFSRDYFQEKFKLLGLDAEYRLFEINQISEIQTIISYLPNFKGLNVTIKSINKESSKFKLNITAADYDTF